MTSFIAIFFMNDLLSHYETITRDEKVQIEEVLRGKEKNLETINS